MAPRPDGYEPRSLDTLASRASKLFAFKSEAYPFPIIVILGCLLTRSRPRNLSGIQGTFRIVIRVFFIIIGLYFRQITRETLTFTQPLAVGHGDPLSHGLP